MLVFQSMMHVTITIACTVFILMLTALRQQPFRAAGQFVQEIVTSRKYFIHFIAMIAILCFNKIEISLENHMQPIADFTPSIYKFEGNFVFVFQRLLETPWLTYTLSFFYIVVFPALTITSILIYTFQKNYKLYYAICYALMLNYMIAIPFYLFFPVNEVHAYHPEVKFLILQAFPTFETEYRPLSDLDNCIPSLHTSISISVALIALRSQNTFWRRFVPISALIIIASIFYLGIHWLTDMAAGLVLGVFAAQLALRLSEGRLLLGEQTIISKRNVQKW